MAAATSRFAAWFSGARHRFRSIPWRDYRSEAFDRILLLAKSACVVHIINAHVVTIAFPLGSSMLPTLNLTGDVLAVDRLTLRWNPAQVGDIVAFISPINPRMIVIKRVLGVEGDTVTYRVDPANGDATKTIVVPKGNVWVQGDNIYSSRDSRVYGPIPRGLIWGRAVSKIWPPKEFGWLDKE